MRLRKSQLLLCIVALLFSVLFFQCKEEPSTNLYPEKVLNLSPEKAMELSQKIRQKVAAKVVDGLELTLWASDSLVTDPIAISMDDKGGIYYTQGTRLEHSEFDIRGHRDWMTASISFESVEDRRAFLREQLDPAKSKENEKIIEDLNEDGNHDWYDLLVEKESVWYVTDETGDGVADKAKMFIEDFNEEISDLANGVLFHEDEVFISIGPDLWRTKDFNGDGIADEKESISHGWAVHIGFGAHGMSGVTVGPQGRIWWGIGDIGMNVIDKAGNKWKYPNQGVIVRCDRDGSNFEVFAMGVRNTHEFVFDDYGNLISEDNDGDHPGERERLVYLPYGSDSGWRANWQYGKYTDPKNNKYKVWMDEKLHIPRWEGQAAYITPPIMNYVNGPTGMVYNPGTGLGEKWKNHFFIAEFRGSPANSPIHAFTLIPKGASFEMDTTIEVVKGVLPTGIRFGPDGALYFADWVDGWGVKEQGRIWKLDVPGGENDAIRKEVKQILAANFKEKNEEALGELLGHTDQRIRQKSQFELAKRGEAGLSIFKMISTSKAPQLARIHSLWGMAQMARNNAQIAQNLPAFLDDQDPELIAQAAKMIGDLRSKGVGDKLISLLKHESLRIQFFAAEALGRTGDETGFQPVLDMLIANDDKDAWLRHAGILALASMDQADQLIGLKNHESRPARIAAVVALRRMKHSGVSEFLKDTDEYIVTEAARAINDDFSIPEALPALANLLNDTPFENEPLIRRAINANLRLGQSEHLQNVVRYVMNSDAPEILRAEAIATLSTWAAPSPLDRVDGRKRKFNARDAEAVKLAFEPIVDKGLKDNNLIQIALIKGINYLKLEKRSPELFNLFKNSNASAVKLQVLESLNALNTSELASVLELALEDKTSAVRSKALQILPETNLPVEQVQRLFGKILKNGTVEEKQAVFAALGKLKGSEVTRLLDENLEALIAGNIQPEIQLDIIEAIENQEDKTLSTKLASYQNAKPKDDPIALYREALFGGDTQKGRQLFSEHEAAQCTRCHRIWEWGGDAGPSLMGVGNRLSKEALLLSMVDPSAEYSSGYAVAMIELKNGESTAGIVQEETDTYITLKLGKDAVQTVEKADIAKKEYAPSAMLPMADILTKREMRDMVAFLSGLKKSEAVDF
jgi:putative membrane-bound dehydrogenase-like protein